MQRDKVCDGSIVSTGVQPGLLQGQQHFSIIPTSFVLPEEVSQFLCKCQTSGWSPLMYDRSLLFVINRTSQPPSRNGEGCGSLNPWHLREGGASSS